MAERSDSGVLECRELDERGGSRALALEEVAAGTHGLLWLHMDFADPVSARWLQRDSGLEPTVVEALLADESRPRFVASETGMLIVLRGVNTNPGADPEDMVSVRIWVEPRRIVSTRRRRLLSVVDLCAALDANKGPRTSGEFVIGLVSRLTDRIGEFVNGIEETLAGAEEALAAEDAAPISSSVSDLRRQIASVRRFLAPQRDALDRLYRHSSSQVFSEGEGDMLREEADRMTRYLEDLDLARERAMVLREEYQSLLAVQQNSRMYLLSIVAAIFLPLSFITGLFGMNVGGMPGVDNPRGFVMSMGLMLLSAVLLVVVFRLKRWL